MRFMYIVTSSHPPGPPTPALMEAMGKLADREIKAGRMIDSGGLMPVAMGAQVRITDGELRVVDGPDAVPDAVGLQRGHRLPDRLGTGSFAGVRHRREPAGLGDLERPGVRTRREVRLRAAEP